MTNVTYIEFLEYVHDDINSRNILLNNEDQFKLVDFNHVRKINDDLKVDYELYIRFYRRKTTNDDIYKIVDSITK